MDKIQQMKLENHIRKLHFKKGEMSQQALADATGVTRMTIYSIEKGKFVPSTLLAFRISKVLGEDINAVFFLTNDNVGEK